MLLRCNLDSNQTREAQFSIGLDSNPTREERFTIAMRGKMVNLGSGLTGDIFGRKVFIFECVLLLDVGGHFAFVPNKVHIVIVSKKLFPQ